MFATQPAPTVNPIPSMLLRWPGPRCANLICRLPGSTESNASCAYSSTTAKISSLSAPGSSPDCAGIYTKSILVGCRRPTLTGPALSLRSQPMNTCAEDGLVLRLARRLVEYLQGMTLEINALTAELTERVTAVAPSLLAIVGCGPLTAAKILGETAQVRRFRSKDAFARLNGTAPVPVWSSNKQRHRLSRTGNRQLNAALHRIAMTQARMHPPAQELLARRKAGGDGGMEALRILKRRLSDVVYRAMLTDESQSTLAAA
jgi:Transposase IS116/IS110/IS902 family